mgnify:CR=1 FL=1
MSETDKPLFILVKIDPGGKVEIMPTAQTQEEHDKAMAAWKELINHE